MVTLFVSQELNVDRETGDMETIKGNAVSYSSVKNPFLMPLDAFFVKVLFMFILTFIRNSRTINEDTYDNKIQRQFLFYGFSDMRRTSVLPTQRWVW